MVAGAVVRDVQHDDGEHRYEIRAPITFDHLPHSTQNAY